ncbi:MAG: ATP phosphoribosyltransferase regulatory subunit [Bacillota bacterium]|nr:ATP phosphoribosyltransferase regulatory subunit [Bacillota bacterium]
MNYDNLEIIDFIDLKFNNLTKKYGFRKIFPKSMSDISVSKLYDETKFKLLKVIDNTGDINILHEDPTISILDSPISSGKFFYLTNTFSFKENSEDLKGGVEILLPYSINIDIELIVMIYEFLESLGVSDFEIEIGNTHFIEQLLNIDKMSLEIKNKLFKLIHNKNILKIEKVLNSLDVTNNEKRALLALPKLFGDFEEILGAMSDLGIENTLKIKTYFKSFYELLSFYKIDLSKIKIDLSFTNKYSYYDGFIFKAYSKELGKEIITGGRYDVLNKKGTGFGFNIKNLIGVIKMNNNKKNVEFTVLTDAEGNKKSIIIANNLRRKGFGVNLLENDLNSKLIKEVDSNYIIATKENIITIVDNKQNKIIKKDYKKFMESIESYTLRESIH